MTEDKRDGWGFPAEVGGLILAWCSACLLACLLRDDRSVENDWGGNGEVAGKSLLESL